MVEKGMSQTSTSTIKNYQIPIIGDNILTLNKEPSGEGNFRGEGVPQFVPRVHSGEELLVPIDPRDYTGPPAAWMKHDHGRLLIF